MKTLIISAALIVGLAFAMPGHANHGCNGVVTAISVGSETVYIDDRSDGAVTLNHWIYLESNGVEGLQSGGTNPWAGQQPILTGSDGCHHENSDQMIF